MFLPPNLQEEGVQANKHIREELNNRHIRLSKIDDFLLFSANLLGPFFFCCWSKKDKLQLLYSTSEDRINNELDIVKIMKRVRNTNILLK